MYYITHTICIFAMLISRYDQLSTHAPCAHTTLHWCDVTASPVQNDIIHSAVGVHVIINTVPASPSTVTRVITHSIPAVPPGYGHTS